jgi:hypothetical protein
MKSSNIHIRPKAYWFLYDSCDEDLSYGPSTFQDFDGYHVPWGRSQYFSQLGVQHKSIRRKFHLPQFSIQWASQLAVRR